MDRGQVCGYTGEEHQSLEPRFLSTKITIVLCMRKSEMGGKHSSLVLAFKSGAGKTMNQGKFSPESIF